MNSGERSIFEQIERSYEGRWIDWDTLAAGVVADGETVDEAAGDPYESKNSR